MFAALKPVLATQTRAMAVKTDTGAEYTLVTRTPSPYPQHKGQPLFFGSLRLGKAYVSFHLLPLYMRPPLQKTIPPALKKRMQGKACFNFRVVPEPGLLKELKALTAACAKNWGKIPA